MNVSDHPGMNLRWQARSVILNGGDIKDWSPLRVSKRGLGADLVPGRFLDQKELGGMGSRGEKGEKRVDSGKVTSRIPLQDTQGVPHQFPSAAMGTWSSFGPWVTGASGEGGRAYFLRRGQLASVAICASLQLAQVWGWGQGVSLGNAAEAHSGQRERCLVVKCLPAQ